MPKIECPICESAFGIDKTTKLGQPITCPTCNESFPATRRQLVLKKKTPSTPTKTPPPPPPLANPPTSDSFEPKQPADTIKELIEPDVAPVAITDGPRTLPISARRRKSIIPMFVLALLFIIALGLFAVLWKIIENGQVINLADQPPPQLPLDADPFQDPNLPNAFQPPTTATTTPQANLGDGDSPTTNTTASQPPKKTGPPSNHFPLLAPASSFWPRSKLTRTWQNLHPRLVRLIAHTPSGQQEAIGTVIDSRGWVVTSLRAVAGAAKIEVIQLSSNLDQIAQTKLLTDLARGVVAVDEKHDLVILSVNRRFVVAFDSVRFPDKDRIAGDHRVAAPLFPEPHSRAVLREFSIDARKFFADFDTQYQDQLSESGLNDQAIEWATFELVKPEAMPALNLAGAPIFNDDGEIAAITTPLKLGHLFLAVPTTHLNSMIKMADNQTAPIASINDDLEALGITSVDPATLVESQHPLKKLEVLLNQSGEACAKFEFQPQTGPQYAKLQDLLKQLVELQSFVEQQTRQDELAAEENKKFTRQINHWLKMIHTEFGNSFSNDTASKLNQLAIEGFQSNPDAFFLAFATVKFTAFDGPKLNGDDAVTLEFVGTQQLVAVPFTDDLAGMLPGSTFLIAGYPPRKEKVILPFAGKRYPSRIATLVFVKGPYETDD